MRIHRFDDPPLYKVGITEADADSLDRRFNQIDLDLIEILHVEWFDDRAAAKQREAEILAAHADDRYHGPGVLTSGNTELFTRDILDKDHGDDPVED